MQRFEQPECPYRFEGLYVRLQPTMYRITKTKTVSIQQWTGTRARNSATAALEGLIVRVRPVRTRGGREWLVCVVSCEKLLVFEWHYMAAPPRRAGPTVSSGGAGGSGAASGTPTASSKSTAVLPAVRIKIISMGNSESGKSCLIKRFCEGKVCLSLWCECLASESTSFIFSSSLSSGISPRSVWTLV